MEGSNEKNEVNDARTTSRKMNPEFWFRTVVIVVGANILLSCMIFIMVILMFPGQKTSNEPLPESILYESDRAIMERFPGYFRTQEEQDMLVRTIRRDIPVSDTVYPGNCTPSQERKSEPWCPLIPAETKLHACCASNVQFVTPDSLKDVNGHTRKLAVFGDSKQFFRIETCAQLVECDFCTCNTEEDLYSGVYVEEDEKSDSEYGVANFLLDGSCKCFSS